MEPADIGGAGVKMTFVMAFKLVIKGVFLCCNIRRSAIMGKYSLATDSLMQIQQH